MDKTSLRTYGRQARASIPDRRRQLDAELLKVNIMNWIASSKACNGESQIIGTYYPCGAEIVPPPFIAPPSKDGAHLAEQKNPIAPVLNTGMRNCNFALPVIRNETTLEFYEWAEGEDVVKRDFDIPIPDTRGKTPVTPDILLMPLVLCDRNGNRIGQGAGHYDRYIAWLDEKPFLIGVCFDEQVYPHALPVEPHDQRLDLIITPKRIIEIS